MTNIVNEIDILGLVRYTVEFYNLKIDKKKFLIETFFSNFGENKKKLDEIIEKSPLEAGIFLNTIRLKFNEIVEEEIKLAYSSYSNIVSSIDGKSFVSPKVYQILIYSIRVIQKLNYLCTPRGIFPENANVSSQDIKILILYLAIMFSETNNPSLNNTLKQYNSTNINIPNEMFDKAYQVVANTIQSYNKSSSIMPILQNISKGMLASNLKKMSNRLALAFLG